MIASLPHSKFPEPAAAAFLTLTCIQTAAAQTGLKLHTPHHWAQSRWIDTAINGRRVSFRLALDTTNHRTPSGHLRRSTQVPYQKIVNRYGKTRRVNAVCWHGHRDFMIRLFDLLPDLVLRTAVATYRGRSGFLDTYLATGDRNIGSVVDPQAYSTACNCYRG